MTGRSLLSAVTAAALMAVAGCQAADTGPRNQEMGVSPPRKAAVPSVHSITDSDGDGVVDVHDNFPDDSNSVATLNDQSASPERMNEAIAFTYDCDYVLDQADPYTSNLFGSSQLRV